MSGKVKWFNEEKGYGFITVDGGKDVFCHITDVVDKVAPSKGQAVEFTTVASEKGLRAVGVGVVE